MNYTGKKKNFIPLKANCVLPADFSSNAENLLNALNTLGFKFIIKIDYIKKNKKKLFKIFKE